MAQMGSRIEADTSSKRPGETWKGVSNESGGAIQADRSAECRQNSCWRRSKPVTVNPIELVEV